NIIAPNCYHYLFAASFKDCYPKATFWAAPGLQQKEPELPIDRTIDIESAELTPGLQSIFLSGFRTLGLSGFDSLNECIFFHPKSRTLILTDAAFHFDASFPLLTQLMTRVLGGYQTLSPSWLERIATTDKKAVRESIEEILRWDFERVIMAHGSVIEKAGKEAFINGYESFLKVSWPASRFGVSKA
ncbi:hypothetical protein, partial [cf. Phormidesmis sp. LEGE 11477]|uniref:hypothetical protein n=1 Tax=cf. Phormidesmis sp. LEGE 11477 TaxID=1828680 RepID=UPI001880336A